MGNLKEISPSRMISITEAWLDPARDREKIAALASGRGLLDIIQSAHEGLVATHRKEDPASREISSISEKQARIDKKHDRKIRAVYHLLNGLAEASDDPNEIADLITARDELLPRGLSATKDSYSDEAENVEIAAKRISASSKAILKKIVLPRGLTLWAVVEQWFAAGRELATLEQQKARLEAVPGGTVAEAMRARNTWIRVVRHVESTLELEGVREDIASAILQPVRYAEDEAERRHSDAPADSLVISGIFEVKST